MSTNQEAADTNPEAVVDQLRAVQIRVGSRGSGLKSKVPTRACRNGISVFQHFKL